MTAMRILCGLIVLACTEALGAGDLRVATPRALVNVGVMTSTGMPCHGNLLPTILAQVGDQGSNQGDDRNQNGNVINENIQVNVRNVIENNDRMGCTYKEFLACNPKEYDGKGGTIVYTRWIEKKESVQDISGCRDNQKVKYTIGSFVGKALTWWNSQIHIRSREATVSMSWEEFKTLTREEFCTSNEMQKLETELWNHVMVGAGHAAYTDRFRELARLVPHLVTLKNKRIERYVYGLATQILGMMAAMEPTTIQKAVQIAGTQTDEAIKNGSIKRNPEKRGNRGEPSKDKNRGDDNKRTRTGNAFATTTNPIRRENTGTTPKCTTCKFYHPPEAPCRTCFNCNRPRHIAKDCRVVPRNVNPVNVNNPAVACGACFECGGIDHYKSACLMSTSKAFGGNTRDLGSFGEETDKTPNVHQHLSRLSSQRLEMASQDTCDAVTIHPTTVLQEIMTALARNGYSLKDKNKGKTDKTRHENGKSVKSQNQRRKESRAEIEIKETQNEFKGYDLRLGEHSLILLTEETHIEDLEASHSSINNGH
ncbi:reverse transcriptase domain-containing protein [Tanacetum coccineum]